MTSWPLRFVIPTIAVVLVLATEAALGTVALALVQRTLTEQVDRRLDETAAQLLDQSPTLLRMLAAEGAQGGEQSVGPTNEVIVALYRPSGEPARLVNERLNNGRPVPQLELRDDASGPYTARAGATRWRVQVVEVNDAGVTLAVMMPLRDPNATTATLARAMILLGGALALVAAVLAWWATDRSLRPLREAEHTAAAIASGDLARRVPAYPATSEAGSLALSLNTMLDQLTASVSAREASEERLRRFVSDASHELRTPLAAIRGYAELSRMGADADGAEMHRIEANAERMATMVEDLLLLARYDEGAAELAGDERVDLARAVADAAADLRVQDPSREVTVAADGDCIVAGSRRHLGQLLANLCGNVLTHTPEGSRVDLSATRSDDGVVVTVRDWGEGFGEGHAERVFERFYRADTSRTRETGGSGLGLAIAAAIVDAHGGTIQAADASPGALVTVTLPAASAAPHEGPLDPA